MTPEPSDDLSQYGLTEDQLAIIAKLPERLRRPLPWLMSNWPGRVVLRMVAGFQRIQIFDRSMTIAAQLFTSVFPIIIMGAALFGATATKDAADAIELPGDTSAVLDEVVTSSGGIGTFGIIGVLVVLVSATSLSRALTRAYDAIWQHGRTKTKVFEAWRWIAAVMVLALAAVVARFLGVALEQVPPRDFWSTSISAGINIGIGAFIPWLLMAGRVPLRRLMPGALLYGVAIFAMRPFWVIYLPTALENSNERYGAIGIAFVYLTYLYAIAFALLGCAVIGYVIATDEGSLGKLVRGDSAGAVTAGLPSADARQAPQPPEV
jgi:membrane protein